MTCREAMNTAAGSLTGAGTEDGGRIAALLLREALRVDSAAFIAVLDRQIDEGALAAYKKMAARAACGEPVQYILGRWDFYGRTFRTDRRALIPRPETELLVEAALKAMPPDVPIKVMDAGCGTGCIGITLKLERPESAVVLCDVSREALSLAAENAGQLCAGVQFAEADMRKPFPGGPYDVIVSNPPYIDADDMATLPSVVVNFEPHIALHGGADGLDFVRALAGRAIDSLKPFGRLFIEIGYNQAEKAIDILHGIGAEAEAYPDYSGIPRVIAARKGY